MQSQSNIFYQDQVNFSPLAYRLRPRVLEDLVGAIKNNPAFVNWLRSGAKQSAIFWGPPGSGKTSIAHLAAQTCNKEFIKLQAFNSGVKDLREIIERAERVPNSIVLFVDEIHNFNKNQQDTLLNAVERGILTLIGATTENPAISINKAVLSRTIIFELAPLEHDDLATLIKRALTLENKSIDQEAQDYLINACYGDARSLLTKLELLINNSGETISLDLCQEIISKSFFSGDANTYYDCVSALQKSLRGSDVKASIYWLARLIHSGAELESIARRILVTAAEDIGIADPQALVIANAAYDAALKLGLPEARIPLAQAVYYIAQAPKSNTAYKALDKALNICNNHPPYPVPEHLRGLHLNSCPAKSNNLGSNPRTNYKYPHDYPGNWVEQNYLPEELKNIF